ncbi:MAG TPA: response regulator transcription factor [Actinophytocola sp.]|nr:response regulator transcription factor [Actinophytocola sp.]
MGESVWGDAMEHGRSTPQRGNVLIVGQARFYWEALAQVLANGTVNVVGSMAHNAVACVRELEPNAVLVDLPMDEAHRLIISLRRVQPAIKIIALSVPETERAVVDWAYAGATACVTVDTALEELPALIEEVARGNVVGTPRVAGLLFRHLQVIGAGPNGDRAGPQLTERELRVLRLVAQGLSNKEIARALSIRLPTVKNHLQSIFGKLGVRRRTDAAQWLRLGGY